MFSAGFFSMVLALASKSNLHFPTSRQSHMFSSAYSHLVNPRLEALDSGKLGEDKAQIVYDILLVGGIPTTLKNHGVRQLG
jgi:hypothetical protein